MNWFHFGFYALLLGTAFFIIQRISGGVLGGFQSAMSKKAGLK